MENNLWKIETQCFAQGYQTIAGVDEAGRGPLAGPVCAAAVILPPGLVISGLNDSKKLSPKKREQLYDQITAQAISYAVALVDEKTIDEINILQATFAAMRKAVSELTTVPDLVLIDGNQDPSLPIPTQTVVKGDSLSANIAAASILAKVTRDRLMVEQDAHYPGYGFAVHKGYGTKQHYAAIDVLGACPIHRRTFLRKYYEKK